MLKKEISYTDYNGNERTDTRWFNLTQAELLEMELGAKGGLMNTIQSMIDTENGRELTKLFKDLILNSYGVKSPDGQRFIKSEELRTEFSQTEAYSNLFVELVSDEAKAAEFVAGIIPAALAERDEVKRLIAEKTNQ